MNKNDGSAKKILNKNNKGFGLFLILINLLFLFSLIMMPYKANPFYLFDFLLMGFVGFAGTFSVLILSILSLIKYYFTLNWFTKKRIISTFILTFSLLLFSSIILNDLDLNYEVNHFYSFNDYLTITFKNNINTLWDRGIFDRIYIYDSLKFNGLISLLVWVLGGFWWNSILTILIIWIFIIYFIYVILFDEYIIIFSKLQFWKNDENLIEVNKEDEGIDLNLETAEFELTLNAKDRAEREKLTVVENIRKNVDKSKYENLSKKISLEKSKLEELREKVVKRREIEKNNKKKTTNPEIANILKDFGYSSYSKIKKPSNETQILKKDSSYINEEEISANKTLIKKGYQTVEQSFNLNEGSKLLNESILEEIVEDIKIGDKNKLVNEFKNNYNEEIILDQIDKTLENKLELSENNLYKEVIIKDLNEEETVEEHLELNDISNGNFESQETFSSVSDDVNLIIENEQEKKILSTKNNIQNKEEIKKNWCTPYILPSTSILSSESKSFDNSLLVNEANDKAKKLNETFSSFGVKANTHSFEIGPTITTFKISLAPGIKTTRVTNLEDNIKLVLGAEYIRILAPIPGTSFIGIEIPNSNKRTVYFKNVYDEAKTQQGGITIAIGQGVSGNSLSFDLTKAPHLLVAGSTGSGKSVAINTILASILLRYNPHDVQLILIDPKMVEFAPFNNIPHLMANVITDAEDANIALKAMVDEMESRYKKMASMGAKKIEELNDKLIKSGKNKIPYIIVIIDELADLMMVAAKEVEESIMRITQKARAAGIHMILATQRPSTEIITGTIKSNIPSRIAFTVASSIDSRTILGQVGAEKLIGMGDMLVSLYGQLPIRGQGAFISNEEVDEIVAFTKTQCSADYKIDIESLAEIYKDEVDDEHYISAKKIVLEKGKASTSMLQRTLNIGYNKAANIIERLENEGIIGPENGTKPREVY